jgi:hypothetical protein
VSSIVLEFQKELSKSDARLTDLLRKGILIASKLNLNELEQWLVRELEGYKTTEGLPEYRKTSGMLYGSNPYIGKIPLSIPDKELEESITRRYVFNSISEMEKILEGQEQNKSNHLSINFPGEMQQKMQEMFGVDYRFEVRLEYYQLQGIIDSVKTTLLKWALQLEKDGILGDEYLFSESEKKAANQPIYNTYNTFYGNLQNSQIQQHTKESTQSITVKQVDFGKIREIVQEILAELDNWGIDGEQREDLEAELKTIISQLKSSNPKMSILKECWTSSRTILEGVTGSLIASGLAAKIQFLSELLK